MPATTLLHVPTAEDIRESHRLIQPLIHRTPIMTCEAINEMTGADIHFKCENFQKIGAFKMRGAANAASRLTPAQLEQGLATHSSGNHAQAVARAAQVLGVPAFIVMPKNAPAVKVAGVKSYGAEVVFCECTIEARETKLNEVIARTGAYFIHPFDDYNVIAGQATAPKELLEDANLPFDIIMAPAGGGGLLSGTALAAHYFTPDTQIIGAEPFEVDDAYRSFHSGKIEHNATINTIADGLRTYLSEKTLAIIREHVTDILRVEEEAIVHAMRLVWERMKIIIEPSSAVPLAAVHAYPEVFKGKTVGIILTGGNVDIGNLPF
ncbi:MAG: threonine ammonia-lyase [Lewinella sp.]|jgi:threonine dehydratase|uniref:threonine ammonia-lyase n=1 Tax=Lewinella sp. TaxID=2004506 RepID=UPI003D6A3956